MFQSTNNDEDKLTEAIKAGDHLAFERLFNKYYPRLENYARRFVADPDIVQDIIQESFVSLWERHASLVMPLIGPLLFTMVRNGCLNHLKHEAIVRNHYKEVKGVAEQDEGLYKTDFSQPSDQPLMLEELQQQIERLLEELPPRTHEVFLMSRNEGLKNREVAEKLGISIKVVEKHITKALKILTARLDKEKNEYL